MAELNVAIVGAGIGGLATAHALNRKGIDVAVYEQARQIGEVGAGIGLSPNSVRLLERLGLGTQIASVSSAVAEIRLHDWGGKLMSEQPTDGDLHCIYRPDLVDLLLDSLPEGTVATGRRAAGFSQDDDHATVAFDDGAQAVADVVVAADGIHSALQQHAVSTGEPVFSGSIAYRGVLPADRLPDQPSDTGTVWMGDGRHFILYPPFHGGQLINFVGVVPSDAQMRESWSAPGDPKQLAAEFAGWDSELQRIIGQVETTFRWGLYDREPLTRWTHGRLTLLGDAAHPMLPHAGQGANQAIGDAVALATLLDGLDGDDAPQALLRYESLRRPHTAQLQHTSRINGQLYDSPDATDRNRKFGDVFAGVRPEFDYDVEAEAQALS
jgi:salicylate hydroxylase